MGIPEGIIRGIHLAHIILPADVHRWTAGLALFICIALGGPAQAFHDQGVGACSSCHIIHNSEDGASLPVVGNSLLRGDSPSELCLSCHATANGAVLGSDVLSPTPQLGAGNFVFLFEDSINDDPAMMAPLINGQHAGHSVVAPMYGLYEDTDFPTAPGGSYPSSELGCTSCHDPHGNCNFRMLYGAEDIQGGLFTFINPAPIAEGLPVNLLGIEEGQTAHTAYKSGMSDWCANCHGAYHDLVGGDYFEHPFDAALSFDYINRYNSYDGAQNPSGGSSTTSYLVDVPFEDSLATITSTQGPTTGSKLVCVSCHRAHGTSAPRSTRWDMRVRYLDDDGLASGSWPIPDPWGFPNQPQLCLKCHAPDHALNSPRSCSVCHSMR